MNDDLAKKIKVGKFVGKKIFDHPGKERMNSDYINSKYTANEEAS